MNARIVLAKEGEGDGNKLGVNPKINNLKEGFEQAKWDIVWVIDATISVVPSTLARSVEALVTPSEKRKPFKPSASLETNSLLNKQGNTAGVNDDQDVHFETGWDAEASGVGLIHHVPFAWVPDKSLGSRLEQVYLNSTHAKMYLAIVSVPPKLLKLPR